MVDNLKSAVFRRIVGQAPVFNPATWTSPITTASPSPPAASARATKKGRVENAVGYVKKNFLAGLELPDFAAVNPAARQWLETVANVRIHGETRKSPSSCSSRRRPSLLPLSA